jgi:molecular chaperone HscB
MVKESSANPTQSLCWSCRSEVGSEPQCPNCVKLQPLGRNSDYFTVMGLPRKLSIDARVLEPVFHALSRRFHPDVYRMASSRERMIALENSAVLNQAYRTLRDPFERAAYLSQLEAGRSAETKSAPPADLFEEILEIQELLGEYRFAEEAEKPPLRSALETKLAEIQAEQSQREAELTGPLFSRWDALQDTATPSPAEKETVLADIRRILGERAYLRRVLNRLHEALAN